MKENSRIRMIVPVVSQTAPSRRTRSRQSKVPTVLYV